MAGRKQPYMKIETKEEFDKLFKDIYGNGKEEGFREGIEFVLSMLYELQDQFPHDYLRNAQYILSERRKDKFARDMRMVERKDLKA